MSENDPLPIIYGLEFQSRSLIGLYSNSDEIRFAAGTQSIRSKNQLHLLTYDDENHSIKTNIYNHDIGEIWGLTALPFNPDIIVSTYLSMTSDFSEAKILSNLWQLSSNEDNKNNLKLLTELPTSDIGDVKQILSCPNEENKDLIALIDGNIVLLGYNESSFHVVSKCRLDSRGHPKFNVGSWGPHHGAKEVVAASETNIHCWDINSMKVYQTIENAHSQMVRDIDHNPNRQYYIISSGDDCMIKFWDLRNCKSGPVKEIEEHTHWVWKARYNSFHDELILSGGSDGMVGLHLAQSVSSESYSKSVSDDEDDTIIKEKMSDGLIQIYEEHEDSVYALDWSPVDPWVFASLSYDGRLVINQVPRRVKYNILL